MEVLTARPLSLPPRPAVVAAADGERGVSLIETLVALLILSFVAVSTLAMFSQGMRLNAAGADYTAITNIAKDKSEELMSLAYDNPSLLAGATFTEERERPPVTITWRVAEHFIAQDSDDPNTVFGASPMASTAAGSGNLKVISVTVNSEGLYAIGRRTVTVQAMLIDQ